MPLPGTAHAKAPGSAYYDEVYARALHYRAHWGQSHYATLWRGIVSVLQAYSTESVLEIGCGTGQLAACLKELLPDMAYSGFDFSEKAIEFARKAQPDGVFSVSDVRDANSYAGDYEAVIATEVFEHLDDDLICLRQIDEGKLVIFSVPNFDDRAHVRYFQTDTDVFSWYTGELENFSVTWTSGYWLCVGRR